jgi:MFS family permease
MVAPVSVSLAANLAPEVARGRYLGVFGLFHQLGWSLGPWAGGVALEGFAPQSERTWYVLGAVGLAAAAAFSLLRPHLPATADRPDTESG